MRSPHRACKRGIRGVRFRGHAPGTIRAWLFNAASVRASGSGCALCVESASKLGVRRQPLSDPGWERRKTNPVRVPQSPSRLEQSSHGVACAALSTCNPARLGIRESVSLQRLFGWVADANHAASSDGPPFGFGRLAPKVALAARCNGRTRPLLRHLRREIGAREPRHRGTQLRDASGIAGYGEGRARAWRQKAFR